MRSALDIQGTSVSAFGGNLDRANVAVNHGGLIGSSGSYRVYSQFNDRRWDAPYLSRPGAWDDVRGGFRMDWQTRNDTFSVTGDAFRSSIHNTFDNPSSAYNLTPAPADFESTPSSESMLFHREHKIGEGSSIAAHASYFYSAENAAAYLERRDTIDADFQHRTQVGSRNDLLWGVEFKSSADRFTQGLNIAFIPDRFRDNTASGFVQDKISLAPVKIRFCQYLNNIVEQDHRLIKSRVKPMLGFKSFYNARRVLIVSNW